jgi:hypothetical protein
MLVATLTRWHDERRRLRRLWREDRRYGGDGDMSRVVKEAMRFLPPNLAGEMLDRFSSVVLLRSRLHVVVYRGRLTAHGRPGDVEIHGITSRRVITDAGVGFLVDSWQNTVELEAMKFHGLGTGTTSEAANQTGLTTELTSQYAPDNTRATGTLAESAANVFQTVGTNTLDAGATVQEHGLFSVATAGTGVMWDRSLTGAQTLSASDSLQSTYSMTAGSGG